MKKKVVALMMACAGAVSMAACGQKAAEDTTAAEEKADETADATEETADDAAAGGTLVMATNAEFPPVSYTHLSEAAEPDGRKRILISSSTA